MKIELLPSDEFGRLKFNLNKTTKSTLEFWAITMLQELIQVGIPDYIQALNIKEGNEIKMACYIASELVLYSEVNKENLAVITKSNFLGIEFILTPEANYATENPFIRTFANNI